MNVAPIGLVTTVFSCRSKKLPYKPYGRQPWEHQSSSTLVEREKDETGRQVFTIGTSVPGTW